MTDYDLIFTVCVALFVYHHVSYSITYLSCWPLYIWLYLKDAEMPHCVILGPCSWRPSGEDRRKHPPPVLSDIPSSCPWRDPRQDSIPSGSRNEACRQRGFQHRRERSSQFYEVLALCKTCHCHSWRSIKVWYCLLSSEELVTQLGRQAYMDKGRVS